MRLARPGSWLLVFASIVAPAFAKAAEPFYLKDGDRVVFYGDSITDQRLYTTFTETYVVTRFPQSKVDFVHSGWGGDQVSGGGGGLIGVRLQRDVVAYKPTVVTIMLGMNDAHYRAFDPKIFETYTRGYKHIVETLKKDLPELRLTLIRPSPFDDVTRPAAFEGGYNGVLVRYGDFISELAKETGATVADLNTPVVEATKKAFASDPELAKMFNRDRVHPGPSGQLLMAAALLKAWNAPDLISSVTIDTSGETVKAEHATIQGFTVKDGVMSWNQLDQALPFPINLSDKATALAVASSNVVNDLNRQILQAIHLDKAEYTLAIDGKELGTFSKDQLAKGVNLATRPTPMLEQAKTVHKLTLEHNNFHVLRWRTIQVPYEREAPNEVVKAMEGLDGIEAKIVARQRQAAQPKSHTFVLSPKN